MEDPRRSEVETAEMAPVVRRGAGQGLVVFLLCGCALILHTAIKIEFYNARIGGFLPRTPSVSLGANPKWRKLPWTNERRWRETIGPKDAEGSPVDRPLTAEETKVMHSDIERAVYKNRLRDVVSTWGCLQYPAVLTLLVFGGCALARPGSFAKKTAGAVSLATAGTCGALMVYRGYIVSLGY